jgi:hypothetical protein
VNTSKKLRTIQKNFLLKKLPDDLATIFTKPIVFSFPRHLYRESCVFSNQQLFCKYGQRAREIDSHKLSGAKIRPVSRSIEIAMPFLF